MKIRERLTRFHSKDQTENKLTTEAIKKEESIGGMSNCEEEQKLLKTLQAQYKEPALLLALRLQPDPASPIQTRNQFVVIGTYYFYLYQFIKSPKLGKVSLK